MSGIYDGSGSIGLLQLTITWYKIRHAGGQAHYYSRTGTLKQGDLNHNLRSGVPFVFVGSGKVRRSFPDPTKTKGTPDRRLPEPVKLDLPLF